MTTGNPGTVLSEEKRREINEVLAERTIDYAEIVWGQFKKSRVAVFGLAVIALFFAVAIFAPLLACHVPFSYVNDGRIELPWYRYLVNMEYSVDYTFNMAMFLALAWIPTGVAAARLGRRASGRAAFLRWHLAPVAVFLLTTVVLQLGGAGGDKGANSWIGLSLQSGFLLALAWVGNGLVRWRTSVGKKTPRRTIQWQLFVFVLALALAGGAFRVPRFGGIDRPNVLHSTYDLTDIGNEDMFKSEEFAGRGFWPPIRHSFRDQDREHALVGPGEYGHVLGANASGYDVLTQLIYGTRVALTIGFVGVGIYLAIGTILGALAGYFGGWVDIVISRFIEIMMTFPSFFLIMILVGLLQFNPEVRALVPPIFLIMFVIGIVSWTGVARLVRGEFLKLRGRDFVVAARALGVSNLRIIFRHILPNAIAPALVAATFGVGGAILTEGALSVLGIGIDPPVPSWGKMLRNGYDEGLLWLLWPPATMILVTVFAYNLVGEGLRDALDPRLRK
ncbi:MAG: ABC transporter permease [Planctomycetes bacterium]|nr:ABC transporter permease [Planctomycetota bacterium]